MVAKWLHGIVRAGFGALSWLAPGAASRIAERLFAKPPPYRGHAQPAAPGKRSHLDLGGQTLAVCSQGPRNAPAILLVHGWGGVGAQMEPFIAPLVTSGYRVVWYDQPGHGESGADPVTIVDFVRAMQALDRAHGPFDAAVGHSLGAAALALALRQGLALRRAVFISPPASIGEQARRFARALGLPRFVRDAMRRHLERRAGMPFAEIDRHEDLRWIHVPALFLHDADDAVVAYADTRRIAAFMPNALRIKTRGLGHYRILRDAHVVRAVVDFVTGGPLGAGPGLATGTR